MTYGASGTGGLRDRGSSGARPAARGVTRNWMLPAGPRTRQEGYRSPLLPQSGCRREISGLRVRTGAETRPFLAPRGRQKCAHGSRSKAKGRALARTRTGTLARCGGRVPRCSHASKSRSDGYAQSQRVAHRVQPSASVQEKRKYCVQTQPRPPTVTAAPRTTTRRRTVSVSLSAERMPKALSPYSRLLLGHEQEGSADRQASPRTQSAMPNDQGR